jgi:hypothetical protein
MQATITYLLTEQAQRAQMAATGQPVARKQSITVEVGPEDLPLMQVADDGTPYLNLAGEWPGIWRGELKAAEAVEDMPGLRAGSSSSISNCYIGFREPNPDVLGLIRAGAAAIAQSKKEDAEKEAARMNAIVDQCLASDDLGWRMSANGQAVYNPHGPDIPLSHPRIAEVLAHVAVLTEHQRQHELAAGEELFRQLLAEPDARQYSDHYVHLSNGNYRPAQNHPRMPEWIAELNRRDAADKAAKVAVEKAKTDYINTWISENAEEIVQQQHADGLLSRSSAVSMIADAALDACLPPAADTPPEACSDRDCPCGSQSVTCIPRRLYPKWRETRAKLPEGWTVEFTSRRDCLKSDDGYYDPRQDDPAAATAGPKYWTATVTIPCGPFHFTRTVKLG